MDWSVDHEFVTSGATRRPSLAPADGAQEELLVRLPGRFLSDGLEEAKCLFAAIRGRVGRVAAEGLRLVEGAHVVLYLDLVGRIEGTVTGVADGEFGVSIAAPPAKWLRLVQQFEMLARMPRGAVDDLRGFRRIASDRPDTTVTSRGGEVCAGRIANLSRSGAAVLVEAVLEVGDLVRLGSTQARVVRHIDGGVAVQFLRLLPLESFGPSFAP